MITLYSYPTLFGVADNNGYGLKVFAFLRLVGLPFVHEHIFDASAAPRGQLPYMVDDGETIGDSETILAHLIGKYGHMERMEQCDCGIHLFSDLCSISNGIFCVLRKIGWD